MASGPSQFETWPGDRRRIGRNRPKTVNVMGSNEGRDLLAWPLVIPKLNGVECKLALIADQNGPVHLSASNACANPMRRAFNGLENMASALDCPHPTSQPTAAPPDRSRARSDGAPAPLEPASVPSGEKAPRGRCQSHVDCKEQVFLPGGHAASPYCRFVWRLTIIRCASGMACISSKTIASRIMRLVCSKRLPPNCRVVSIGV